MTSISELMADMFRLARSERYSNALELKKAMHELHPDVSEQRMDEVAKALSLLLRR